MSKKTLLRIVVPVLILVGVGAFWFIKDGQRQAAAERQQVVAKDHPGFVLEEKAVDLDALKAHMLPLIMDFGAEDCQPCQIMRPALEKAHADYMGRAVIKFFDVWKHEGIATGYPVRVIPTQVLFTADGKPYEPSDEVMKAGLNFEFYNHKDTETHALTVHVGILDDKAFELILKDMGVQDERAA